MSRNIRSVHAYVCSVQGYAHVERRVVPKSLFEKPFSPHDQGRIGRVCKLMVHWQDPVFLPQEPRTPCARTWDKPLP